MKKFKNLFSGFVFLVVALCLSIPVIAGGYSGCSAVKENRIGITEWMQNPVPVKMEEIGLLLDANNGTIYGQDFLILKSQELFSATHSNASPSNTKRKTKQKKKELYVSGSHIQLPEPYRKGYQFIEWNTQTNCSGDSYEAGEIIKISNSTLYAIWEKIDTATTSNVN